MPLSDNQRQTFFDRGTLRLRRVFHEADAARMVARIWDLLDEKYGARRDDPATWTEKQPTGFQSLTQTGAFNAILGRALVDALNDLLGNGAWNSGKAWGVPLVTFPEPGRTWDIPKNQWHLDFPVRGSPDKLPGIRVFAFISAVEPRGGGTVVAAGSHRLVEYLAEAGRTQDGHSAQVRDSLAACYPVLGGLWSEPVFEHDRVHHFMTTGNRIDGVKIQVQELTGTIGDVILMHPWTFHAPAPNCRRRPRMMVSHSLYRSVVISS